MPGFGPPPACPGCHESHSGVNKTRLTSKSSHRTKTTYRGGGIGLTNMAGQTRRGWDLGDGKERLNNYINQSVHTIWSPALGRAYVSQDGAGPRPQDMILSFRIWGGGHSKAKMAACLDHEVLLGELMFQVTQAHH